MSAPHKEPSSGELIALRETRARTLELVSDLTDEQLMGPRFSITNPLLWEIGHLAWFQEFWLLRHLGGKPPILENGDSLYDSARVAHDTRWELPLLSRQETLAYMREVLDRIVEQATRDDSRLKDAEGYDETYFLHLALFHEQMHDEAFGYTRQTLNYPPPKFAGSASQPEETAKDACAAQADGVCNEGADARIPGGKFILGSSSNQGFVFDNEQCDHEVEVLPFAISKTAVSNGEFLAFVEDNVYSQHEFWSNEGWSWLQRVKAGHPVYWRHETKGRWLRRNFNEWLPLVDREPVIHVNWYEAEAYCRWAGRRLPGEIEWEVAASAQPGVANRSLSDHKRCYPWGDDPPSPERANLDWRGMGCVAVDALPEGDSAFGCRQMIGNVWEWTATSFNPYPGFKPGPYREYSQPWFGDHKVLRGGCWATRSTLIRNAYRNFYTPDRRDVWAGFRTCSL
jgi:ergothioneine biosynthesis protein EgtB